MHNSDSSGSSILSSVVFTHQAAYFLALALVTLLLTVPIWLVSILPWADFGDHMGRAFILAHYSEVPAFQSTYEIRWILLPNLAIDLVATPLFSFFSPDTVAKIFGTLSILVFAAGCHLFGRAVHGRPTWLTIPAVFLFYNSFLTYGYVNFMWGGALFLIAAAAWLTYERAPSLLTGLLATAGGVATYICHLAGFVFLFCFIGMYAAYSAFRQRRIRTHHLIAFVPVLPGLAAYLYLGRDERQVGEIRWATLASRATHAWVLFSGYGVWMDVLVLAGLAATLVMVLRYGTVAMERSFLVVAAAFFLVFLAAPSDFHTGADTDSRFILPSALVAILALQIRMPRRVAWLTAALLMTVSISRIAAFTVYWREADQFSSQQRSLLRTVDEGRRIYPLVFLPAGIKESKLHQQLIHLAGYATIDRHAISGSSFTLAGQQPIRLRTPLPHRLAYVGAALNSFPWPSVFSTFDYVWAYNAPGDFVTFLDQTCDLVAQAGLGRLYRSRVRPH